MANTDLLACVSWTNTSVGSQTVVKGPSHESGHKVVHTNNSYDNSNSSSNNNANNNKININNDTATSVATKVKMFLLSVTDLALAQSLDRQWHMTLFQFSSYNWLSES